MLAEAASDDFKRELGVLAQELESLKAALLRYAVPRRTEALARAVASLPPEKQLVLALRHQEKLTLKEAAAVLGVPDGTICRAERSALESVARSVNHSQKEG
ncbi:MAG: sigma factor-like helix-turn-helix DNA-binding protein [Bacillota bacterium]